MFPSTDSDCYFHQLPDLTLEPIFEFMAPHDLLHLSLISRKTLNLIQYMRTKATISFTFAPNKTTIHVKTLRNAQSEFIIGKADGIGETFNCCFDGELFFQCEKMQSGIKYPNGLETVFNRLLRLYPRAVVQNIEIALSGATSDKDYAPLFQMIQMLQSKKINAENVWFKMENEYYETSTFEPILKIFEIFGSKVELPKVLVVKNGYNFPSNYLELPLKTVYVKNTQMGDDDFNKFLRDWNASERTQFAAIMIETNKKPMDANRDCVLRGVPLIGQPSSVFDIGSRQFQLLHTIQRHSDQIRAAVIRTEEKFAFQMLVDIV